MLLARLFPPVVPTKQTTGLSGEPIKFYLKPSRFNAWGEVKHIQANLYDVATNTNILSPSGALVHKTNEQNQPLYIQADGSLGTTVTSQPYLVASSALQLLFIPVSEVQFEGDDKAYFHLPSSYCPLGKLLKMQVRLSTEEIPENPTPSWITNELAYGRLSEWSSPSVFRVINKPLLEPIQVESIYTNPFPTFYAAATSEEQIVKFAATLNGEVIEKRMSAWAITESFEFKKPLLEGANSLRFTVETEGGLVLREDLPLSYQANGRVPSYHVESYRTEFGGLELTIVDEERSNYFAYPAPASPPNVKYTSATDAYSFVRGENKFHFTNNRMDTINVEYRYSIHYTSTQPSSANVVLRYDYVDGSYETYSVGEIVSGAQKICTDMPKSDPLKGLRYSYLYMEFADTDVEINASSVRIARAKTEPVSHYILRRASAKDGYQNWETIVSFDASANSSGRWTYLDNSAQTGVVYKYAILGRDVDGSLSTMGKEVMAMSEAEGVWLSTEKFKALNFIFDTAISGLRIAKREMVVETLGSQYPFVSTSGKMEYYTFSLSGTLFHEIDALNEIRSGMYHREVAPDSDTQVLEQSIISKARLSYEKNYIHEREVREGLMQELGSIKPVLFKSDGEPVMIVRLTNISINPRRELGNVIYNFNAQVSEVAACTMENIKKYKLQNERVSELD